MKRPVSRGGFTLIELLVVITIIVILLALLVPALDKAIKASEDAKCASNQRNIVQNLSLYSRDHKDKFPHSAQGAQSQAQQQSVQWAMEFKSIDRSAGVNQNLNQGDPTGTGNPVNPGSVSVGFEDLGGFTERNRLGLGLLVGDFLPVSNLAKIIHCPRLDTSSASAINDREVNRNYGMDELGTLGGEADNDRTAGGSWWTVRNLGDPDYRIAGSYHYRGASRQSTGGGILTFVNAKSSYVFLSDSLDRMYGRKYHHRVGYYRAFGDGSASFFSDAEEDNQGRGDIERIPVVGGHPARAGKPGGNGSSVINGMPAHMGGNPQADERTFEWMSVDKRG